MRVRTVAPTAGACVLAAGLWVGATVATPTLLMHAAFAAVACQGDGTTWLPGGWDHRGALLRMALGVVWVKPAGSVALSVGRSFDDQGVGVGGQAVDR